MTLRLLKNGEVLSELIASPEHRLPEKQERCWQDCTIVAEKRIDARPTDSLMIAVGNQQVIPFMFSRCRVAATGWEVEGKVLL